MKTQYSSATEGVDIYKSFLIDWSVWGTLRSPVQSNSSNHLDLIMIFYGSSAVLCCDQNLFFHLWPAPPLDINLIRERGAKEPHRQGNCWASVGHQDLGLLVYFVADCLQLDVGWRWWQSGWQRTVNMSYHHNWYLGKYTPHSTTTTYQTFPGKNFRQHKQYHVLHRLKILPFSGCIATGDRGWYRRL